MTRTRLAAFVLILTALVLPLGLEALSYGRYVEHIAVQIMLLGLYAMSWDLIFGYLGLFSFGHAAFYGVAGYAAGMLVAHAGIDSGLVALAGGVAAAAIVGAGIGFLCARVGSVAVFLVTFACAEALYLVTLTNPFGLTNGDNGLLGVMPATLAGIDLSDGTAFYYLALLVLIAGYLVLRRLMDSPFGRVVMAIRDNEQRVRFAGYNVEQYKTAAFALAAVYAGIAGVLTTFHERIAAPEQLSWAVSGEAVLYATLGGTGTLLGPVLGAGIVIVAREILSDYINSWLILIALTYLALIFFLPGGLYPLLFPNKDRPTETSQLRGLRQCLSRPLHILSRPTGTESPSSSSIDR